MYLYLISQLWHHCLQNYFDYKYETSYLLINVTAESHVEARQYNAQKLLIVGNSVTRCGKISPFWQKFPSLWQMFQGLFLVWQNAEPTLANFGTLLGKFFIVANGQILEINITIWSHWQASTTEKSGYGLKSSTVLVPKVEKSFRTGSWGKYFAKINFFLFILFATLFYPYGGIKNEIWFCV